MTHRSQQSQTLCRNRVGLVSRRATLQAVSCGFGWLAFGDLARRTLASDRPGVQPHFPAQAKHVIFLCMRGGPSHVDTLDYKPVLNERSGQPGRRPGSQLFGSPWKFTPKGECGHWMSDLLPELGTQADKLCVLKAMRTDVPAHPQAMLAMHTGTARFVRPSLGAWTMYGLGSENENLPGFITIAPPSGFGGSQNYGAGFLPATTQATRLGGENRSISNATVTNLRRSQTIDEQRRELDLLQRLNQAQMSRGKSLGEVHEPEIEGLIESFELGFRMQAELPQILNLKDESPATLAMYGIDQAGTDDFGRKCLLARRMVEAGVRFVEVTHGNWDQHFNLKNALSSNCQSVDKPAAGLLSDLDQRGLLDETLVIWSGEFGRTPHAQGNDGRDHNNEAYSCWMAGGGIRGGMAYGESDEFGYEGVAGRVSTHDWHATILHLLGLDHRRLTFNYGGRDFRLTDVYGEVITDIVR